VFRAFLGGPRIARDCVALYDAVASATGREFCVDSSKTPYRFRDVFSLDGKRSLAVILTRDYRAVVYSKMKRGQALLPAAAGWRARMEQIRALTCDLPAGSVYSLSYEALCEAPARELSKLCEFLGVKFFESMVLRPTNDVHHIGGSPSKFDPSRSTIEMDTSYADRFSHEDLRMMKNVIGEEAGRWGYDT
jgi:hypothetical protein